MRCLSEGPAKLPFISCSPDAGATRVACLRYRIASAL